MAIVRANVLGILNEMLDAKQDKIQTDRDFAIRGVQVALDKQELKDAKEIAKRELGIKEKELSIAEETWTITKEQHERNQEEAVMKKVEKQHLLIEGQIEDEKDRIGAIIRNRFIEEYFTDFASTSDVERYNFDEDAQKKFRDALSGINMAEEDLNRFVQAVLNVANNSDMAAGNFDQQSVDDVLDVIRMYTGDGVGFDALGIDFYGSNPLDRQNNKNSINTYYDMNIKADLMAKEIEEWNILGDPEISETLKNWITFGGPENPNEAIEIPDLDSLSFLPNYTQQQWEDLTPEELDAQIEQDLKDFEEKKEKEVIPTELETLMTEIGKPQSANDPEYWNRVETALNKRGSMWFDYQDDYKKINVGVDSGRKLYRNIGKNQGIANSEMGFSKRELANHRANMIKRLNLDKGSNDPLFDYTLEDQNEDKLVETLYLLQIQYLSQEISKFRQQRGNAFHEFDSAGGQFFKPVIGVAELNPKDVVTGARIAWDARDAYYKDLWKVNEQEYVDPYDEYIDDDLFGVDQN